MLSAGSNLISRLSFFATETSFHGFREVHSAKSWHQRVFALLTLFAAAAICAYYSQSQITQYLEGQTVISVRTLDAQDPSQFPPVWAMMYKFSWIDFEKVQRLNLTPSELKMALSYVSRNVSAFSTNASVIAEVKESFARKLVRANIASMHQLYVEISLDLFDVTSRSIISKKKVWTDEEELYFRVNMSSAEKNIFTNTWRVTFGVNITKYWTNANDVLRFLYGVDMTDHERLYLLPIFVNSYTDMSVSLNPGRMVSVSIVSMIQKPLIKCKDPELASEFYLENTCRGECELKVNTSLNTSECIYLQPPITFSKQFRKGDLKLCSYGFLDAMDQNKNIGKEPPMYRELDPMEQEHKQELLTSCLAECLPACQQLQIIWEISNSKGDLINEADVGFIRISIPGTIVMYEEFYKYHWLDFVSAMAGIIGFSLGASVVSIFNIVNLCCLSRVSEKKVHV